jgi:ABC-2 type transport system ATP-binding protein
LYLEINAISKSFDKKQIFNQASYQFETGKIYGILGRNGVGKTTLFQCIARNMTVDKGSIYLVEEGKKRDYDNTEVGFTFTQPHLPGFMTAVEFLRFFIDINRDRIKQSLAPEEFLLSVGISLEDQQRLMKDYSHGMQNKVQMLLSLMVRPPIMLLDEPLTSFDVVAAHEMKEMIRSAKEESIILFSTHILQLAQDMCDEVVLLHNHQLSGIDPAHIHEADFEKEIITLLTEGETDATVD